MRRIIVHLCLTILCASAKADVVLPNIFAHHMVLQRDQPVSIFGSADAGEEVFVEFQGQRKSTYANINGYWKVELKAMKANAVGQTLTVRGKNEIRLEDVLVGEVWLCSGQSNMEYPMRKIVKEKAPLKGEFPKNAVAEAENTQIRIFLVRRKFLAKPDGQYEGWSVAQDSALRQFSAPGYFFAKNLQEELGVPVGIISSAVSGSRIEPWLSEDAFQKSPYFKGQNIGGDPGKFYHSMIEPLAPYTLKGFIWYQGETNVFLKENLTYAYKMKALITEWRTLWQNQKIPFYFTQIAPFHYSLDEKGEIRMARTVLPEFREAQDLILQMPFTSRIVITDLVDNLNDIHPNYKWEVGRRYALKALRYSYKKKNVLADGPEMKKVKYKESRAVIEFGFVGDGLQAIDGKPLTGFEVAGDDDRYYPANTSIHRNTVILDSEQVKQIRAVRFAWDEAAQPNLVNSTGLPAAPFRTDNPFRNITLK
jgi:sialate O-acetylesterase